MREHLVEQLQAENERLKRRVAELEHTLEVQEWGTQLFHESEIPQLLLDLDTGAILAANAAAHNYYGDALIGRGDIMCVCAEGLDWERDLRPLVIQNRYGKRLSHQHTASGEVRMVETHFALVSIRGRAVIHLLCFDVTDRVRAQEALELSHNRYQAFIQLSSEGIWRDMMTEPIPVQLPVEEQVNLIFERSHLAECNLTFCRMWGASNPSELVGTFTRERVSPNDPHNRELVRQFILNGYRLAQWLFTARLPNGGEAHYLCSLQGIVSEGLLWGVWGVFRDVTELICTQRALQESEERYRHFVQYANEGIWRFDVREPIDAQLPTEEQIRLIFEWAYLAECNRAFARMYAVESPESLLGTPLPALLIPTDAQNRAMLKTFIENNYRIEGFVSHERAVDGSERYFLNSFFGVVEDGKLVRAWGVQTDITEMRRLQQELERAYRLESIGRLAGGIAHDFNNVLTAVIGYAELARDRVQDATVKHYLDGILKAAERAADLNKQLLAYARKTGHPARADESGRVASKARWTSCVACCPKVSAYTHQVEPNLWQVNADSNLLMQIVLNLGRERPRRNAQRRHDNNPPAQSRPCADAHAPTPSPTGGMCNWKWKTQARAFPPKCCPISSSRSTPRNRWVRAQAWGWRRCRARCSS
jgi:PAS domain-containing protein